MNRFIKTLAALSLIAFAASCSKEVSSTPAGEEVTVTFSVTSPELQTKTVSDGKTADKVYCAAYDENGKLLDISAVDTPVEVKEGEATWTVSLVTGQTYSFAFWAYKSTQTAYAFDAANAKVTVDYTKMTANDDTFDAFYAYKADYTVNGAFTETVTLTRPFAQLNLGAADLKTAEDGGFKLATAAVKVKGVANTLDLKAGTVDGSADVEFAAAEPLTEKLTVSKKEYDYISMVYVLVGKEQVLTDATYTLTSDAGKTVEVKVPNAPIKANYRTNVVGNLFTVGGVLKIELQPGYAGEEAGTVPVTVSTMAELQQAIADAPADGTLTTIALKDGTYTGLISVGQSEAKNIALIPVNGDDNTKVKIDGCIFFKSGSLSVKNMTLTNETATAEKFKVAGGDNKQPIFGFWAYSEDMSFEFENVVFELKGTDETAIGNWWCINNVDLKCKNCVFNANNGRPIQLYGIDQGHADLNYLVTTTIEGCTFNDPYRYCCKVTTGRNVVNWSDNTVNVTLTDGKTRDALEVGVSSYKTPTGVAVDVINVSGTNTYPATNFKPYVLVYDEGQVLNGAEWSE